MTLFGRKLTEHPKPSPVVVALSEEEQYIAELALKMAQSGAVQLDDRTAVEIATQRNDTALQVSVTKSVLPSPKPKIIIPHEKIPNEQPENILRWHLNATAAGYKDDASVTIDK